MVKIEKGLRFLADRGLTIVLYILAIVGMTEWDKNSDSLVSITFNLASTATFLWWAVTRTVRHYHEDLEEPEDE